ncbi:hypothetical protein X753_24205 [Mesorhizobium sp. LNJC399B00]|nr:hypothetical protein X753_24205 [Mesorhizobium sp. LNJC399B00]
MPGCGQFLEVISQGICLINSIQVTLISDRTHIQNAKEESYLDQGQAVAGRKFVQRIDVGLKIGNPVTPPRHTQPLSRLTSLKRTIILVISIFAKLSGTDPKPLA